MPKLEVGPVLCHCKGHQSIGARLDLQLALRLMQGRGHLFVHPRYQKGIEHYHSIPTHKL